MKLGTELMGHPVYSIYIYIYIYSTWTKVFDHHRYLHTNSINMGLFIKEYVLKLNGIRTLFLIQIRKLHILITHN